MAVIWISPKAGATIATISEDNFFQQQLVAQEGTGAEIFYRFLSGALPVGMQITSDGYLQGAPVRPENSKETSYTYSFAVRASVASGAVADRTFGIVVSSMQQPILLPPSPGAPTYRLTEIFDGYPYYLELSTIDSPTASLKYSITAGALPPGITLSRDGIISGTPTLEDPNVTDLPGYDEQKYDHNKYDFQTRAPSRTFLFSVRVTDGINSAINRYSIRVIHKATYSTDNSVERVDDTFLNISYDNTYVPRMITPNGNVGKVRQLDKFDYKFVGTDPEGYSLGYELPYKARDSFDESGFDEAQFDQDVQGIPPGLAFNSLTGWLFGTAPAQTNSTKEYYFQVTPYRKDFPNQRGTPGNYSLTVLGSLYNTITWQTDSDLGYMSEGKPSTVKFDATASNGKEIVYSLETGIAQLLPQGVKLTTDGYLIGRPTFRRFAVDNDQTIVVVADNTGIVVGMSVTGPGVGTGAKVIDIPDINSIVVAPAVVATAGTALTFFDNDKSITVITTEPNRTTTITDRFNGTDQTTFDQIREFTIRATTVDSFISDTKTFSVRLTNYNLAPYENLYLRALPQFEQRRYLLDILEDPSIFPNDLIYRYNDPWFGKAKDIKVLLLPGVAPSSLSAYAEAMTRNHYNKKIRFGSVKTARAVDQYFQTAYEVVYVDVIDMQTDQGRSVSKEVVNLNTEYQNHFNPYLINGESKSTIYPNSFINMRNKIGGTLGFENRGALPDWMTSPQLDGRVIGFVPCVILAYTVPDAAKIIKYRLDQSNFDFNRIDFTSDRYQLDNILSQYYDTTNNKFVASTETTFDYIPRAGYVDANVEYASTATFSDINGRTVAYILQRGGIDGIVNFADGDTMIFAQQEHAGQFYDGWFRYLSNFDVPFDSVGLDSIEIIPGYLNQQPEITQTGTYTQTGAEVVVTIPLHNYKIGYLVNVGIVSGLPGVDITTKNGTFTITRVINNQTFVYQAEATGNATGICTVASAGSNQGSYIQDKQLVTVLLVNHNLKPGFIINVKPNGFAARNVVVLDVKSSSVFTYAALDSTVRAGSVVVSLINQRSGVWTINIDSNDLVTLTWQQQIRVSERVRVNKGLSLGGTILVYNPDLKSDQSVPAYTTLISQNNASTTRTTFDGNGTKIIDYRDIYSTPESGDKYLKFPQIGVFN